MSASPRVGYRPPLSSIAPLVVIAVGLALLVPGQSRLLLVVLVPFVLAMLRLRQLLVLTDERLEVTVVRTRRIAWDQVEGFQPAPAWRGGTLIRTASGTVHSVAPCSWWGGPAAAEDLETLERLRLSHRRASTPARGRPTPRPVPRSARRRPS